MDSIHIIVAVLVMAQENDNRNNVFDALLYKTASRVCGSLFIPCVKTNWTHHERKYVYDVSNFYL